MSLLEKSFELEKCYKCDENSPIYPRNSEGFSMKSFFSEISDHPIKEEII